MTDIHEQFNSVVTELRTGGHEDLSRQVRAAQHALKDRAERERIETAIADSGDLVAARRGWEALRALKPGIDGVAAFDDLPRVKVAEYAVFAKASAREVPTFGTGDRPFPRGASVRVVGPAIWGMGATSDALSTGDVVTIASDRVDMDGDVEVTGDTFDGTRFIRARSLEEVETPPADPAPRTFRRGNTCPDDVHTVTRGGAVWHKYPNGGWSSRKPADAPLRFEPSIGFDVLTHHATVTEVVASAPLKVGDRAKVIADGGEYGPRHYHPVGSVVTVGSVGMGNCVTRGALGDHPGGAHEGLQTVDPRNLKRVGTDAR